MSDILNEYGLQIEDLNTTLATLTTTFQTIYGSDINLNSNTSDGELLNIIAQMARDNRELCQSVYNSFDLTKCTGIVLDLRVAFLGIVRKGGTYTQIPIDITTSQILTLDGLNEQYNNSNATSYAVKDNAGNIFYLVDTSTLSIGTTTLTFRAKNMGAVSVSTNTVNIQDTIILGITSVNNSSGSIATGGNQETDNELRLRAQKSYALNSKGYLNGLEAQILAVDGVTESKVYENDGDTADSDSIPAHSIWAIAEGGADTDIAQAIYECKMPGCNMKGGVEVDITTISGQIRPIKFDRVTAQNLYIKFNLKATTTGISYDLAGIQAYIAQYLTYTLYEFAETSKPTGIAVDAINATTGFAVPIDLQISTNGTTWGDYYLPTAKNYKFTLSSANISITQV